MTTRQWCMGVFGRIALVVLFSMASPVVPVNAQTVPQSRAEIKLSFAPVVARVAPAVVNIYSRRVIRTTGATLFNDPFFKRFFGPGFRFGRPRERVQNSIGSGVIVDKSGLIVTNRHVIRDADEITVVLADRRELAATVVTDDEKADLAVLRIDAGETPLPFIEFDDSDRLKVGDLVLALGNPFGIGQTVTSGIVSALARTGVGISDYRFFIQTDASINPGNSGGALVGLDGRLVGINTAIYSRSGGSNGIGFAIPANMVRVVVQNARAGRRIVRPWLGAGGQAVTSDIAESLGLARPMGVLVNAIYPGGPADKAGLKVGDIILKADGQEVFDQAGIRYRMALKDVGGKTNLLVRRGERRLTLAPDLAAAPENPPRDETPLETRSPVQGATVANLSPALADEINVDMFQQGVVVTRVAGNSLAARLGIRPGDVLLSLNDQKIETVDDLKQILRSPTRQWTIKLRRNGRVLTSSVRL